MKDAMAFSSVKNEERGTQNSYDLRGIVVWCQGPCVIMPYITVFLLIALLPARRDLASQYLFVCTVGMLHDKEAS